MAQRLERRPTVKEAVGLNSTMRWTFFFLSKAWLGYVRLMEMKLFIAAHQFCENICSMTTANKIDPNVKTEFVGGKEFV